MKKLINQWLAKWADRRRKQRETKQLINSIIEEAERTRYRAAYKTFFILAILALTGLALRAAPYNANEFSAEIFGQTITPNLDDARGAYGFGLSYFFTRTFGAGARTTLENLDGHLFENVSPRLLWRIPIGDSSHAFYAFAQGTRTFHGRTGWSAEIGPGYEWRPMEHVGLYTEIGMRKPVTGPHRLKETYGTGEVGLRFNF